MPRYTIEFSLPDEEYDLRTAESGAALHTVVYDLLQWLHDAQTIKKPASRALALAEVEELLRSKIIEHRLERLYNI